MKESYNKDPLVAAAESMMLTEDVAKIKKKVAQLEVGDKTNYGTVVAIGSDSITFKAKDTPKTKIVFRQRKMGSSDYLLMKLVKLTPDGKKLDKTFKESNEFVGAAAAAKVAGKDEFEFEGEKFPTTIGLAVAKKIMGEDHEVLESNEFVGAAAAAKVAGKDEFEFEGEKFPTTIGLAVAKKIMGESFTIKEAAGSLQNSLKVLAKDGIRGRITDMQKLANAIHKNYKAITGDKYQDSDQVATSEIITDLIIHLKVNPDKFISAWDKTIKEAKIPSSNISKFSSPEAAMRAAARQKYKTQVFMGDDGKFWVPSTNKEAGQLKKDGYEVYESADLEEARGRGFIDSSSVAKKTYDNVVSLSKSLKKGSNLNKAVNKRLDSNLYDSEFAKMEDAIGLIRDTLNEIDREYQMTEGANIAELEERAGEEWFTAETKVKSSGQLYSTFYVQAKDLGQAKKKADDVFRELVKTSYPKDWPSYQKKFTLKVMKGDDLGDIMS